MFIFRCLIGFYLTLLSALPAFAQNSGGQQQSFEDLVQQHLTFSDAGAALAIVTPDKIETLYSGSFQAESVLPLGRLGEIFTAVLLQQLIAAQKLKLEDPVNYHLEGLRLSEVKGEITLQDLLQRSSGLAWRQSALFVDDSKRGVDLKTLFEQELKPPVITPGQVVTSHSLGDLLIAQLVATQSQQALTEIIKQKIITPLQLESIQLGAALAQPRYATGYDSQGLRLPILWASAHEVQGYQGQLSDLARFLQALVQPQNKLLAAAQQKAMFQKSFDPESDLPGSSQGLLMSSWGGQDFFYLDSDWFGYSLRLAYFPQFKRGFILAYNQSSAALKERWTQTFIQQQSQSKFLTETITQAKQVESKSHSYFVSLSSRDQHTWLKVLDLFSLQRFQWERNDAGQQAQFESKSYQASLDQSVLSSPKGQKIAFEPQSKRVLLGFGDARAYELIPIWRRGLDWAFMAFCLLLFLSVLIRSLASLWAYEPQFDYSEAVDAEVETPQPEPDSSIASWDIPALAAFSSGCAATFMLGFYPVLFWTSRLGDQLSFVVRNAPGNGLIMLLVLPLVALVSGLIFTLLLLNEWRARPWTQGERLHYLAYLLVLFVWVGWLAHWNLLGFNF